MTCASTFIAIVRSCSPSTSMPAHSASAAQTATFSADDPAIPAPAGDSPRVRSVRFSARKNRASLLRSGRPWLSSSSLPAANLDSLRCVDRFQPDLAVRALDDLGMRPQADSCVHRLGVLVKQIKRPDVERAAGEIDAGRSRGPNLLHVWGHGAAARARARCGVPCRPSCRG